MSHQREGFARKARVTLGPIYCSNMKEADCSTLFHSVASGCCPPGWACGYLEAPGQAGPHSLTREGRSWAISALETQLGL